jgi:hypothetical protein
MMTNRAQRCDNIRTQRAARENAGKRRGGLAAGGQAGWQVDRQAGKAGCGGGATAAGQEGRRSSEFGGGMGSDKAQTGWLAGRGQQLAPTRSTKHKGTSSGMRLSRAGRVRAGTAGRGRRELEVGDVRCEM